jgi:flagellar L-ring protein precursor FlgH
MRIKILVITLLIALITNISPAQQVKSRSLFTDHKAHNVGDLLTVMIVESSSASNKAKTTTEKSTEASTDGTAGLGPLDFIPLWDASGNDGIKYDGKGQTEKSGSLRAKMTVSVVEIMPNGDLAIEGSRVVKVDNDEETLFLSGTVRSRDVAEDNTVYSYQIANAQISSKGKGTVTNGNRPGFITRILSWIF